MAQGTPVVASDAAGIPEAGGDAARYFKSGDPAELARVLLEILSDPAQAASLRERGKARARTMPWTNTARRTLEIIARVAGRTR
jgi:glycosyltransferase involved in cell wall biosynthesis